MVVRILDGVTLDAGLSQHRVKTKPELSRIVHARVSEEAVGHLLVSRGSCWLVRLIRRQLRVRRAHVSRAEIDARETAHASQWAAG